MTVPARVKKKTKPLRKIPESTMQGILSLISQGESVRRSCELYNIPFRTFLDRVDSAQYAQARMDSADAHFMGMEDLERELRAGEIDFNTFREIVNARKWRLARMRPQVYGDKVDTSLSGKIEITWGNNESKD